MKVAILGGNGQLGTDVALAFEKTGDDTLRLTHADVEIADRDATIQLFRDARPQIVVNTAAMHHVEQCEHDPAKAFAVNAIGARNVALAAEDIGAMVFHISTDYVFDGGKETPYNEGDCPKPLNVYGNSKLAGEYFVRTVARKHFVLRTSGLYGRAACRAKGRNFVQLMLKLAQDRPELRVVDNERVTPTFTPDVAAQIVALRDSDAYGLYHATAESSCSWYEFAREIFTLTRQNVNLQVAGPNEFPAKVPRPLYSVLENSGLKAIGLNQFRSWRDSLREYLEVSSN